MAENPNTARILLWQQFRFLLSKAAFQFWRYPTGRSDNQVRWIGTKYRSDTTHFMHEFENVVHTLSSSRGENVPTLDAASGLSFNSAASRRASSEHTARCSFSETHVCRGV